MSLDEKLKEEQIVATVSTLDMANEIRNRLMRWGREPGRTRLCVYVFFNSTVPDEYHVGVASEWQTKLPEDTVLDAMVMVSDFQEEQLKEEARAKSMTTTVYRHRVRMTST